MKIVLNYPQKITFKYVLLFILFISTNQFAQVGIGTENPDGSAVLDLDSNSKGLLLPRLTTVQRNAITNPAKGLMIYNVTSNDSEVNIGTPDAPNWVGVRKPNDLAIYTVSENTNMTTASAENSLVTGMEITPTAGTYIALFNAQLSSAGNTIEGFSSSQGPKDLTKIYDELIAFKADEEISHGLTFGGTSGETLLPGIYKVTGAPSISGRLTLDGGNDNNNLNPVFIIKASGALTTVDGATVVLAGNAKAENVYWLSGAAMSTAANTTMIGTMIGGGNGAGAVSLGAKTTLNGRMFTKLGAVTLGANTVINIPLKNGPVNLRSLPTFAMFSSSGNVSDVATSNTTGDTGAVVGTLVMSGEHTGKEYPPGTEEESTVQVYPTTYSFYSNNVEVPDSRRTIKQMSAIVSLQAKIILVGDNNPIEVRWSVKTGEAILSNRVFSMIRVN
jgi:hypothetical protein